MRRLAVGAVIAPRFGPRIFDDAANCPAKASVALRGWGLLPGSSAPARAPFVGAWPAATELIGALAAKGRTSTWAMGTHPIESLSDLAAKTLLHCVQSVRDFATATVEALLLAQADTGSDFDHEPEFVRLPFGPGTIHGGGVIAFRRGDGALQAWRLRLGDIHTADDASAGWAIIAAYVLCGDGLAQDRRVGAVEAYEFGATDGKTVLLGKWSSPREVEAAFERLKRERLLTMAHDLTTHPGPHCVDCSFVGACSSAPAIDGLVQGVRRQRAPRKVTASALREYARCPHRYLLRHVQGLPAQLIDASEPMQRGRLIDEWLAHDHQRGHACGEADVGAFLAAGADRQAAMMAREHLGICPLAEPGVANAWCQPDVVALDRDTRVLLLARPDLRLERNGRVVWRETKTRGVLPNRDAFTLVATDVTAALYLVVLASGADGPADALEWEELSGDQHELTMLVCDDDELLETARRAVSGAVADLVADDAYGARPGPQCKDCPVNRWCTHRA